MEKAAAFKDDYPHLRKMYEEALGPNISPENDKSPEILPNGQEYVHRNHWGAFDSEVLEGIQVLTHPVKRVRLTHTGANACSDLRTCKIRVARIQLNHMYHHGLQDIAFKQDLDCDPILRYEEYPERNKISGNNSGPDGRVYEGRGWDMQAERDEKLDHIGDNCVDIAFIGRYKWEPPPSLMLRTCQAFLKLAVELEYVDKNYELISRYPHLGGSGEEEVVEETFEEKLAAERLREAERRAKERPKEPPEYYSNFT